MPSHRCSKPLEIAAHRRCAESVLPMRHLRELWRRLVVFLRRDQFDRDLQEEMDHHIAMRAQAHMRDGAAPTAARQAARRDFGNPLLLRERSRDVWGLTTV